MAKFLHIGRVSSSPGWHNRFYTHPFHELVIVASGGMHVSGEDQHFKLSSGDALLYPAGVYHCEQSDDTFPVESYFIVFEDEKIPAEKIIPAKHPLAVLRSMASTLYEFNSRSGGSVSFADEYVDLMLKVFFFAPRQEKTSWVNEVDDFMSRHLDLDISLDELAAFAGKSKYLFLRQYALSAGMTPIRKLWKLRCETALELLKYTDFTIKEIAVRTGFSDAGHFSRRIKSFCGKTPSEVRNEIK